MGRLLQLLLLCLAGSNPDNQACRDLDAEIDSDSDDMTEAILALGLPGWQAAATAASHCICSQMLAFCQY